MPDDVLFQRIMAHGPAVRIRRTSEAGKMPVTVVLEVDRRYGTPREGQGMPPPLLQGEADTEADALALFEAQARDDRAVIQLLHAKGLR
ncbi:MAG: hypothetical protein ACREPM_13685 [Gemmatimonadaceae bacterium]